MSMLSFKPQCVEPVVLCLAMERVRKDTFNSFSLKLSVSLPGGFISRQLDPVSDLS